MTNNINLYKDLSVEQQHELANAWSKIAQGIGEYEALTGADCLHETVREALWNEIEYQRDEIEKEEVV